MRGLIDALKKRGIAARDIQTAQISLSPNMNQDGSRVLGYTASNSVTARIRKIGDAGPVIDAAVAAGANQVSGPSLTTADQQALYRKALKAAIANARVKANAIASAAHLTVGSIRSIVEGSTTSFPQPLAESKASPRRPRCSRARSRPRPTSRSRSTPASRASYFFFVGLTTVVAVPLPDSVRSRTCCR